jgi:hypothetical protein
MFAVSGDTVVVGAPSEGSNATGVNGDQHNHLAEKARLGFHGGTLCVKSPLRRLSSTIGATDGLACIGCAGNCRMFKRNFNQLIQAGTDPMLTAGQTVYVQVRQHDPGNLGPTGFADNLSDALAFIIGP